MFDIDSWNEIYATLRKNLLRTLLTAFGVGWGVLMLIIMLGAGSGMENGVRQQFAGFAANSAFMWTQSTSMPYKGFKRGRRFELNNSDVVAIEQQVAGIEALSPRNQLGGYRGGNNVNRKSKAGAFSVMGDYPAIQKIQLYKTLQGRFINQFDLEESRKICVLGESAKRILFEEGEDPIGDHIKINGVYFKVVGVFGSNKSGEMRERDEQTIIIPLTTYQNAFNDHNHIHWFALLIDPKHKASEVQAEALKVLAERHSVHPDDPRAFGSFNGEEEFHEVNMVFSGINFISWFVGIMTLIAGVIGVSNIMLVVVKERTKEIGIRRAIGASPWTVKGQIILESITLTLLAGITGMVVGVWIIEGLNSLGMDGEFFANPTVELSVILTAIVVLVVSGAMAGLIPANRATAISTVDALRSE